MKKILVLFISISLSGALLAQEVKKDEAAKSESKKDVPVFAEKGQKLTVPQIVKLALERNSDLLSARLDATTSDSAYQKFQSKYDIYFGADGGIRYQDYPELNWGKYGKYDNDYDVGASIRKMFSSGTAVTASVREEYFVNKNVSDVVAKTYRPVMFLQLQQELLKNSFGYSERQTQSMLENQSRMQKNYVISRITGLVAGAMVDVWDVSLKKVARDNAELSLRETRRVRDVTANNVRLGISETYDLNFYNAMLSAFESRFTLAEQMYKDSVRKLYRTLNYEFDGDVPDIGDVSVLSDTMVEVNIEESLKIAFQKRVDYNNAAIAKDAAQSQLSVARNDLLPSFTVSGSVSSSAIETSAGTANGKATALDTPAYSARFAMTYPLGDSNQAANERDARAKLKQSELDLEKTRKLIRDDVISKAEMIKVSFTSFQRARASRLEYDRYYQGILANLRMGKTSSAVVKNALDAYNDSRQREQEALVQYNVALMQYDIAINMLLEKYSVDVEKYIAEAK
jgi:outer membrane protein TolC